MFTTILMVVFWKNTFLIRLIFWFEKIVNIQRGVCVCVKQYIKSITELESLWCFTDAFYNRITYFKGYQVEKQL